MAVGRVLDSAMVQGAATVLGTAMVLGATTVPDTVTQYIFLVIMVKNCEPSMLTTSGTG